MNRDGNFAVFYAAVISVALVASLYADNLDSWNRVVFTFPPETQKVVNGTATMEIQWRWLPETLEMIIKVNDDDNSVIKSEFWPGTYRADELGLLFDSDHSGNLSTRDGEQWNDHGVFICSVNKSAVMEHCFVYLYYQDDFNYKSVLETWGYSGGPGTELIAINLTDCYCVYKQDEGYTFNLCIPTKLLGVSPPTPIYISFTDDDRIRQETDDLHPIPATYQTVIAANFTG